MGDLLICLILKKKYTPHLLIVLNIFINELVVYGCLVWEKYISEKKNGAKWNENSGSVKSQRNNDSMTVDKAPSVVGDHHNITGIH